MNEFKMDVLVSKFNPKTLETTIEKAADKVIYNLDGKEAASKWVRTEVKGLKTFDAPQMSSAITVKKTGTMSGRSVAGHFGYMQVKGNNVYNNTTGISITTECYANGHGLSVISENFDKICSLFTARKSIQPNWINCKDEYMVPNVEHKDYQQWNNDTVVYALFNTSSNQSSLRNVNYKDKSWNIENQWFWMSVNDIKVLANHAKDGSDDVWQDIKAFGEERFVYNKLQEITLSEDAKAVLDLATKLVKDSFKYRKDFHSAHPEYQVNTWDAGWYQIKAIVKEYLPEELKKFNELYKRFEDRMRKGVYKFGFLKE